MKNVVFIVNIKGNYPPVFFDYSFKTWDYWTKKNNATLFVLEKPFRGTQKLGAHLQKYLAFEVLKENKIEFDQIAIVDADTMIKWDCPNFFDIAEKDFRAVLDDELPRWVKASLAAYQGLFPKTMVNWWEYFNSGMMILPKRHDKFILSFIAFLTTHERDISEIHNRLDLKVGFDQTLFNFFIKQHAVKISYLPKIFNFYHLAKKKLLEKKEFINYAYIWHFNGIDHIERERHMQETWDLIKEHYQS